MRCRYWIIFLIATIIFLFQTLYSSQHLKLQNSSKHVKNKPTEIAYKEKGEPVYNTTCYRVLQRNICKNYNGLYFNATTLSEHNLTKFEDKLRSFSQRNTTFYDYRFFTSDRVTIDDEACEIEVEQAYCEVALRSHPEWLCSIDIPLKQQFYGSDRLYRPDLKFFEGELPILMDNQLKTLVQYISKLKIQGDTEYGKEVGKYKAPSQSSDIGLAYCLNLKTEKALDGYDLSLLEYQLRSLLHKTRTMIVVHIDDNYTLMEKEQIKTLLDIFRLEGQRIDIMPHSYAHTWGTATNLYVELSCMAHLFELSEENPAITWDYVINLSIYDFAIKPLKSIQSQLHKESKSLIEFYKGTNHDKTIRYHPRRVMLSCQQQQPISGELFLDKIFKKENFEKFEKYTRILPLYLEKYAKGSPWYILTRYHALYILNHLRMRDIYAVKYSYAPEETFIHTILNRGIPSDELSKKTYRITGIDPGPVDHNRQNLTMKHWPILSASSSLYARKVSTVDLARTIADHIDLKN